MKRGKGGIGRLGEGRGRGESVRRSAGKMKGKDGRAEGGCSLFFVPNPNVISWRMVISLEFETD